MSYRVHSQLGQIDPWTTGYLIQAGLNWWDQEKVKSLVPEFPRIFQQAQIDFAKLKVGVERNLFTPAQITTAMNWFSDFPQLWETIRLNFIKTDQGREFGGRVDDFIGSIKRSTLYGRDLGLAPAVIAGVLIVGGVAAGMWAVVYMQKQGNLSKMIDRVTTGALPPEVLVEAIKAQQSVGIFGDLTSLVTPLALTAAAFFVYRYTKGKR